MMPKSFKSAAALMGRDYNRQDFNLFGNWKGLDDVRYSIRSVKTKRR